MLTNVCSYAENIVSAGNSLLSIVNDILDFSRIESGRMTLTEADYRLSGLMGDVSGMISLRARDKGLDFRMDVDDGLPDLLRGDEVRVRQILTNLMNNAVKYTNQGGVTLTVRRESDEELHAGDTVRLVIAVSDTGIGIRQEDIGRLFTKFERVDMQRNSTIEGSGLGLAITRSLLDMMGGDISVESVYGEGSVFTVTLPQKVVSTQPVGELRGRFDDRAAQDNAYEESFRAPKARVLIVDDTKLNLTVAAGLLKKTEMQIDMAGGGEDAVALAREKQYDVILMDQRMPGMDGTEALRRIRADGDGLNRQTPVVCLTANVVSGARERCLAEGFADYLSKPIDSRALEQTLLRHLPAGKITAVRAEKAPAENSLAQDDFAPLRGAGIDPDIGLHYCQRDADFYRSLLREYAQGAEEKLPELRRYYAAGDWENYAVLVHALKSTSKMLGASELSSLAARMEAAANEGNGEAIRAEHDAMMTEYEAVVYVIRAMLPGSEAPAEETDGALEFLPEDV